MRIVVSVGSGLGNVVMTTPLISACHQIGHEVYMLFGQEARNWIPAFQGWEAVSAVAINGAGKPPAIKFGRFFRTRWGPPNSWIAPHCPEIGVHVKNIKATHEAEANMTMAASIGWHEPMPAAHVEYDEVEAESVPSEPYVALLTGCNPLPLWDRKRWPANRWTGLVNELGLPSVFLGAKGDSQPWMKDGWDLCGLPLRQALGVLKGAKLAIGIDCGLAHCAAALGVPTIVLNGSCRITKNRPLGHTVSVIMTTLPCAPCQYTVRWKTCKTPGACMEAIALETVVQEAKVLL